MKVETFVDTAGSIKVTTIMTAMTDQERDFVPLAIQSVLDQTVASDILIFLRHGSEWATDIQTAFPQVKIVLMPLTPLGKLRNIGVKMARTEWIAFLDGDDEWSSTDKLAAQLSHAERTKAPVIGCDHVMIDSSGRAFAYGLCKEYALPSSWLVKRALLLEQPFDTSLGNNVEDWVWFRDQSRRKKTARLPVVYLRYRVRSGSLSSWEVHKARKERLRRLSQHLPGVRPLTLFSSRMMRGLYKRDSYVS